MPKKDHKSLPNAKYDQKRRFHAVENSPYILPADFNEQERLVLQHKLITFGFGKLFHMPIEEQLKAGNFKVLDCGCGPGAWGRQVAKTYPNSTIVGLDMARTVLDNVDGKDVTNFSFVEGNVLTRLPFDDNTFDAVYQRLLFLGVTKDKWVDVVKELKRVTKPEGYIEMVEVQTTFSRPGPDFLKFYNPMYESMTARGLDLDAGINLKKYMEAAGLNIEHEAVHSAPVGWGGRLGELYEINFTGIWASLKPFLSKALSVSDEEYDEISKKALEDCAKYESYFNVYSCTGKVPLSK